MNTGKLGLDIIKQFEGLRLDAYPDPATGGSPWTIGYGHTAAAGSPKPVKGMRITEPEAEAILRRDLGIYETAVLKAVKVPMNQNQFDAMVSLCFNIGPTNFAGSSLVSFFNAGKTAIAAERFLLWIKANGKVMKGLERRREAERRLFETPVTGPAIEPPQPAPVPPAPPEPATPPTATEPRKGFWAALAALLKRLFG